MPHNTRWEDAAGRQGDGQARILKDDADKDDDNEAWDEDEDEDEAEQWVDISKLPVECVL